MRNLVVIFLMANFLASGCGHNSHYMISELPNDESEQHIKTVVMEKRLEGQWRQFLERRTQAEWESQRKSNPSYTQSDARQTVGKADFVASLRTKFDKIAYQPEVVNMNKEIEKLKKAGMVLSCSDKSVPEAWTISHVCRVKGDGIFRRIPWYKKGWVWAVIGGIAAAAIAVPVTIDLVMKNKANNSETDVNMTIIDGTSLAITAGQ